MKIFIQCLTCLLILLVLSNCTSIQDQVKTNARINQSNVSSTASGVMAKVILVTPINKTIPSSTPSSSNDSEIQASPDLKPVLPGHPTSVQAEFQVIFEFKGQTFSTQLPFDPGEYLLIQDTPPQNPNTQEASAVTAPGNLNYVSNNLYVLPPIGTNFYPYPAYGFYTAFPVYFGGGFYHRLPGRVNLNHGVRTRPSSGNTKGRGRK